MGSTARRLWAVLWVVAVVGVLAQSVRAAEEAPTYVNGVTRKLGRGIANVATAPLEILRHPVLVDERDGRVAGLTIGLIRGAIWTVWRAVGGAWEVVTFPLPIPGGFRPVVEPEFVFAHGQWSP